MIREGENSAISYAKTAHRPRPSDDPLAPPTLWEPPRWVTKHSKRVVQYIAATLYEENLRLRRELGAARTKLALYRARDRNQEHL